MREELEEQRKKERTVREKGEAAKSCDGGTVKMNVGR